MRYFISLSAFIIFFSSCSDKSKSDLNVFRATEEGLQLSNTAISHSNEVIYHSLEEQLEDSKNWDRTIVWQPKALQIKTLSDSIINYIRGLKEELKNEAGPANPEDNGSSQEGNLTVTNHVFESHGRGKELFEKLLKYQQQVLSVDSGLNEFFRNKIIIFTENFDYSRNNTAAFIKNYFNKIPLIAAYAMLSKFENNVKVIENTLITFCESKTRFIDEGYTVFSAIVGQSSNYVKAGDNIEITAGVGAFSVASKPKITIDGKDIQLNKEGVVIYKFKTPVKAGKYFKAVKMEYTKPDGTKESMTKNIEYTVIEPNKNPQ